MSGSTRTNITKTKHQFIQGQHGEEYKRPFFWAPFVFYGKSNMIYTKSKSTLKNIELKQSKSHSILKFLNLKQYIFGIMLILILFMFIFILSKKRGSK